jgi:hypothetical protein
LRNLEKITPIDGTWSKPHVIATFTKLLTSISSADRHLSYTTDDLDWLVHLMDQDPQEYRPVLKMLQAWFSAPDTLLTPAEVAEITVTAESTWRNKAARGEIPGAIKKGKQWLLPASVLRAQGVDIATYSF